VDGLRAGGATALYDAIKTGVEMSDAAAAPPGTIRAVVVLTDGMANAGQTRLDDLIRMTSRAEVPISKFGGFEKDATATDATGQSIAKGDLVGESPRLRTTNPVQVFFIGIGDADIQVGRLLAEATGAEFQGATEKDLAAVLEQFSKYF